MLTTLTTRAALPALAWPRGHAASVRGRGGPGAHRPLNTAAGGTGPGHPVTTATVEEPSPASLRLVAGVQTAENDAAKRTDPQREAHTCQP